MLLHVHVLPRAGKTEITGRHGDALRIRVAAPPVDGRATAAALAAVADALRVSPNAVTLVGGERSRLKRFRITGLDVATVLARLRPFLETPGG